MSVYTEDDTRIRFSILKREKPKNERNLLNFRNKNDSDYKICFENETAKLIELNEFNLLIKLRGKERVIDYNSSPKTVINSLICMETTSFTKDNSNILRKFIKEFINSHYNDSYIDEIINSKINIDERIKNFKDSKAHFSKITNSTINFKENLANDLNSTSNPKTLERLNALKGKIKPSDYLGRFFS